jgi:hypothetical protein
VLFCVLATEECKKKKCECGVLVVNGLRPFLAAPLVVRRRYLAVVPRPLPLCASQVLDRGAQADARGAAQVLDRGVQAVSRGSTRCASQLLERGAQADARGAAQVLGRGVQAAARGAATRRTTR